jgi:hypothetical protein
MAASIEHRPKLVKSLSNEHTVHEMPVDSGNLSKRRKTGMHPKLQHANFDENKLQVAFICRGEIYLRFAPLSENV